MMARDEMYGPHLRAELVTEVVAIAAAVVEGTSSTSNLKETRLKWPFL